MQFLTNSTCVKQPVLGREHSGSEQLIPWREGKDKKGRKAQRPPAKQQKAKLTKLNQTEWNQNSFAQNCSPVKDCSAEPEKMTPIIYKA